MNTHLRAKMKIVEALLSNEKYIENSFRLYNNTQEELRNAFVENTIKIAREIYEGIRLEATASPTKPTNF